MLVEAEENIFGPADYCVDKWSDELEDIKAAKPDLTKFEEATVAICLENTDKWLRRMDEVTRTVNVGSFINYGFELISAVMPSLIANQIVSIQPQTRRNGEIFFLEFLYGTTRGNITAGDKMFSHLAAGNPNTYYSSQQDIEENIATGNGTVGPYTGNINTIPIVAGSFAPTDGTETFTDDGAGVLTGSAGGTGTINYTTGAFSVTFGAVVPAATVISATYDVDFEQNPELIPEVDISITSEATRAVDRALRAQYSIGAAYDMESAFGRVADAELKAALASEVRQEIDGTICKQLAAQALSTSYPWSRTPPDPSVPWVDHKWSFYDQSIIPGSNAIFSATRRAQATFIVAGINVCNVIEACRPQFKGEGQPQPGPHYIGKLNDIRVYKNPFYPANQYVMGYKGNMFLEAGYIYAPYMPLYVSRTAVLDDLRGRFGMMQSAARKMINAYFYSKTLIT
jgi:hypothetical protein